MGGRGAVISAPRMRMDVIAANAPEKTSDRTGAPRYDFKNFRISSAQKRL
jgi:hypothetical protein